MKRINIIIILTICVLVAIFVEGCTKEQQKVYAYFYYIRGYYHAGKGRHDKAISDFNKVLKINPKYAEAYNNLGWLYATAKDPSYRNGSKAIRYAKKAVVLEKTAARLDALAAAYAEEGYFPDAVKAEKEAVRLCTDANKKKEYEALVEAYQSKKTYVQFKYGNSLLPQVRKSITN